ncbi:uncharacterized protein LY79DRAFT_571190 [Colletotrichum navitas]|uniref:UBC core domain-containing protein n=1 Tax=Colletotrichum navitas TaxID=681940 RepID=A0AAD8PLW2_9PEZI|nr:uncharacterized protein LY79DRAFT_571190 [Colletotrichum navitas]KAK1569770.1 hypothetical protein LY79DRAFT_571190 [Colletotrichum navitas]
MMNTAVEHPNVNGSYICASILNTSEGYTPAYTLKGIAIQMLSFFNIDSVEQDGEYHQNLDLYRRESLELRQTFCCSHCGFDGPIPRPIIVRLGSTPKRRCRQRREKTLVQLRDEHFDRHGAPPSGAALHLSSEVRRLHSIDNFQQILLEDRHREPTKCREFYERPACVRPGEYAKGVLGLGIAGHHSAGPTAPGRPRSRAFRTICRKASTWRESFRPVYFFS